MKCGCKIISVAKLTPDFMLPISTIISEQQIELCTLHASAALLLEALEDTEEWPCGGCSNDCGGTEPWRYDMSRTVFDEKDNGEKRGHQPDCLRERALKAARGEG